LDIVNRDARVNSLIIGTSCAYRVSKCGFNDEFAIPRPLYCGLDSSDMNSSYNGLFLDIDVDTDVDFLDFVFGAGLVAPLAVAVVRFRLATPPLDGTAIGLFLGGILLITKLKQLNNQYQTSNTITKSSEIGGHELLRHPRYMYFFMSSHVLEAKLPQP